MHQASIIKYFPKHLESCKENSLLNKMKEDMLVNNLENKKHI